ncbi:MAG: aminotransferase class V-fold PLP-dependent enzyme, partial [Opitutaceae bacterium]|nr:aminotransferase class V-fold PLP-dependent enzyme [Opitutaceae bacterium]
QKSRNVPNFVGESDAIKAIRNLLPVVAASNSTVLITGESGTGKEIVARSLHELSPRAGANFVPINCAAIPKDLIESELFGHKKGAFTGAVTDRVGRFELAHNGSIFLDEIGDLPLELQVKLLRVLQERVVDPVGGTRPVAVDVRVIAATHRDLEAEIAARQGCKHGIAVNSGTDALRILMDAVGIGPGDEVITTAFTFVASAETIVQTGARPVFVDIDPITFQIDPAKIEAAITPRTKAILPIHLFGQMCDMTAIKAIGDRHEILVLEDAAQAIDSTQHGVPAGSIGIGAGFSFYVTKNLGAAGDAGLIVTNDDELAQRCRSIRVHGMGRERYYYDHIGYTSRMDEVQAAVLRVKLTKLTEWNARRAAFA